MNWLQKILSQSQSNAPQQEPDIQRPLKQSYQVSEHLWAGEYPGDKNGECAKDKLNRMMQFGVRCFFDLTEEGELIPYKDLLPSYVSYTRFPIRDVSVPQSIEDVRQLVKTILQKADGTHGEVYVHCWGGVGRTGTIIACLIAEEMESPTLENKILESPTRERVSRERGRERRSLRAVAVFLRKSHGLYASSRPRPILRR